MTQVLQALLYVLCVGAAMFLLGWFLSVVDKKDVFETGLEDEA